MCYIVCNEGYTLPYKVSNVYRCGQAGVWSPETLPSECIGKLKDMPNVKKKLIILF